MERIIAGVAEYYSVSVSVISRPLPNRCNPLNSLQKKNVKGITDAFVQGDMVDRNVVRAQLVAER